MNLTDSNNDQTITFSLEIAQLINGYIRDNLTISEHRQLDEWVCESFINQQIFELLTDGVMQDQLFSR